MKQKCKSLFCALLCLVLMCATVFPVWAATTAPAFGTDVSQHNGKGVDYTAWKNAGKTFTMIRMSYGNDHLDPQFWDNVNAAEAAGVPFGVYHYSYAFNTKEATIEANYVKSVLAQMKGKYKYFVLPVAYDLEDQLILNNSNKKNHYSARHYFLRRHSRSGLHPDGLRQPELVCQLFGCADAA